MNRLSRFDVMLEIRTRFANRAVSSREVPEETLLALVEAASFAPSCFNEQPWRFLVARGERREVLAGIMTPANQEWAGIAPALILTLAKRTFTKGGKDNRWHMSDAGCAAGFLMLEAEHRGLVAHPMAGFKRKEARELFEIPEDFEIVHLMAVGYPGDPMLLSPHNQERNHPMPRMAVEDLLF